MTVYPMTFLRLLQKQMETQEEILKALSGSEERTVSSTVAEGSEEEQGCQGGCACSPAYNDASQE